MDGRQTTWRHIVAAIGVALGMAAGSAQASVQESSNVKGRLVQVDVYDRASGMALPVYASSGRNYIVGTPGHEYGVRIRNCTHARLLVVTSVDGVNVISGDTAAPSQSGYVLEPWGYVVITGWRKSMDRTAAFYFTDLGDSYAARTGRPQNVGVVGVAVFQEKLQPIAWDNYRRRLGRCRNGRRAVFIAGSKACDGAIDDSAGSHRGQAQRRLRRTCHASAPTSRPTSRAPRTRWSPHRSRWASSGPATAAARTRT